MIDGPFSRPVDPSCPDRPATRRDQLLATLRRAMRQAGGSPLCSSQARCLLGFESSRPHPRPRSNAMKRREPHLPVCPKCTSVKMVMYTMYKTAGTWG